MKRFADFRLLQGFAPIVLTLVISVTSPRAMAEDPHFPTSEELRHLKAMGAPQLSPDGKQVLFSVTDSTADGAKSHLWLAPVNAGPARQLTYSPASDKRGENAAVWAPDGSAIFFVAKRGETPQIFRLPLAGGEAIPYDLKTVPVVDDSLEADAIPPAKAEPVGAKKDTPKPEPLVITPSGFAVSPDGHWLAIWASDPETPGEKKAKEAKADAVWVNHQRHGERLYLAALKPDLSVDGSLKPVALAPDVQAVSWSPKSDRMIVVTELPNEAGDLGPAGTAWVVSVAALDKPTVLKTIPATIRGGIEWSNSGTQIVFAAQTPEDAPPGQEDLFLLDLPMDASMAKGEPRRLLQGFKGSLGFGAPVFLGDSTVLISASRGTKVGGVKLALQAGAAPAPVTQATPIVASLGTNRSQTGWVWLAEGSDHPTSLCFAAQLGGACTALSIPDLAPQHFRAIESKLVSWQSDGLTIEGLLYLPPEAAKGKVPLIVDVHGGPLGAWEDRYQEWTGFLLGHGWAILRPNPRGSSAYGVAFAAANKNDLGGGDFRDVMAGVDYALKNYPIDPAKLALMGYSYGGEMAGFAEGKTDRFKAIISCAPVIDQFSEYGTERGSWYDQWYFGKPWEHLEDAWRQSPLSGAAKAKTPFLLIQGEADVTDPLGQAQEMYRALRQEGVPVDLVTYPREDHGPLARGIFGIPVGEPWHGFDARQRMIKFLQSALGGGGK